MPKESRGSRGTWKRSALEKLPTDPLWRSRFLRSLIGRTPKKNETYHWKPVGFHVSRDFLGDAFYKRKFWDNQIVAFGCDFSGLPVDSPTKSGEGAHETGAYSQFMTIQLGRGWFSSGFGVYRIHRGCIAWSQALHLYRYAGAYRSLQISPWMTMGENRNAHQGPSMPTIWILHIFTDRIVELNSTIHSTHVYQSVKTHLEKIGSISVL